VPPASYIAQAGSLTDQSAAQFAFAARMVVLAERIDLSAMDRCRWSPLALHLATRALPEEVTKPMTQTPAHVSFAHMAHSASAFRAPCTRG
jgi:hypothetical protein